VSKVLFAVTGGSGLLGANMVASLARSGMTVAAIYKTHGIVMPGVTPVLCNLLDSHQLIETFYLLQPEYIIHTAAATNVDWCEAHVEDCMRINADVPREIATVARQLGAKLVYISTDSVFAGERGNYDEDDVTAPINAYARSKALGEAAILSELASSLVIRTNIYGWNMQEKTSLAEWILGKLECGVPFPAFQDVVFTPVLVNDLCDCIFEMVASGLTGIYHVGGSEACSKYDFAQCLAEVFELDRSLIQSSSVGDAALPAPRPRNTSLNVEKITRSLGRTLPGIIQGLSRFKRLRMEGFVSQLKAAAA
jgi:dTDP-4-dehydrorhamnose reductase